MVIEPVHVTLEPNEANTDGCSITLYFPKGVSREQATAWVKDAKALGLRPDDLPLWVDTTDKFFGVTQAKKQPFPEYVRFQADPTC